MSRIDSSTIPRLPSGLIHKHKDDLHFFLHPLKPRWIVTNQLGKEIIDLCDGRRNIEAIASKLSIMFDAEYARVETDTMRFIGQLGSARLLYEGGGDDDETAISPVEIRGVFIHVTDRCNLRCIHCYASSGGGGGEPGLTGEKIRDLIDELAGLGGRSLTVSGGEPLLRDDWYDILDYASGRMEVTLNTNGTLITRKTATLLSRLEPHVQVSLDGPSGDVHDRIRGAGTFDAAVRGIRRLQDAGLGEKLVVSMTLMKVNISSAPGMLTFVQNLGVPSLRFLPLHSQGRARSTWGTLDASFEDYMKWFRYIYYDDRARSVDLELSGGLTGFLLHMSPDDKDRWCGVGKRVVVDYDGYVYPCSLLMDDVFRLGNVNEASLAEIGRSQKLREVTETCISRRDEIPECGRCDWKSLCQAACPALIYLSKGTWLATDDFCEFRKKLFDDMIFELATAKRRASHV